MTKREKHKQIKQIIKRLTKLVESRDLNLLNTGCTEFKDSKDIRYLSDELIDLRLYGAPCSLPLTYTNADGHSYFEATAEVIRQATEYLYPVRTWLKAHWVELVSCGISIAALVFSIA